jgi:hypothetical protein
VNCTLALLRQGFRERLTQTGFELADVARRQLGKDTMALVSWLYTLEPGTDIDFHEDLIKLALLEDQLIGPFDKAAEYDHVRVSFLCRKADIVTVACTRFGKELSEQAGIDVVARMLRMRDRLEMVGGNFWKQKSHFNAQIHEKRVRKFGQTKINRIYDSSTQGERKEQGEKQKRKDQTN